MAQGVIYILTNPSFPEYVKIGYAAKLEERLRQLNRSEAIPYAFRAYATYEVESNLTDVVFHDLIDRLNPDLRSIETFAGRERKREFYAMSPEDAYSLLECIAKISGTEMFKWRDYDELQQAKEEINKIIVLKNEVSSQNDINDIIREFKVRQDRINRNIYNRFPKIKRWTKTTMVLATPLTIASAISGNIPMTVGSAVVTGIAQATENILEIYKNKNNWVGFVNDMKNDAV